jgi:hypothetical protein
MGYILCLECVQPKLRQKQGNKPKTSFKHQENETFTKLKKRRLENQFSKVVKRLPSLRAPKLLK